MANKFKLQNMVTFDDISIGKFYLDFCSVNKARHPNTKEKLSEKTLAEKFQASNTPINFASFI